MSNEIHVGDTGTSIRITIKDDNEIVDISGASLLQVIFAKPDGTRNEVNGSLYTDGTDGIIEYILADGDIDQPGMYKIQAYVEISGGSYYSSIGSFKVLCNLI